MEKSGVLGRAGSMAETRSAASGESGSKRGPGMARKRSAGAQVVRGVVGSGGGGEAPFEDRLQRRGISEQVGWYKDDSEM